MFSQIITLSAKLLPDKTSILKLLYVLTSMHVFDSSFEIITYITCYSLKQLGLLSSQDFQESPWDKIWKRKHCVIFTLLFFFELCVGKSPF